MSLPAIWSAVVSGRRQEVGLPKKKALCDPREPTSLSCPSLVGGTLWGALGPLRSRRPEASCYAPRQLIRLAQHISAGHTGVENSHGDR